MFVQICWKLVANDVLLIICNAIYSKSLYIFHIQKLIYTIINNTYYIIPISKINLNY